MCSSDDSLELSLLIRLVVTLSVHTMSTVNKITKTLIKHTTPCFEIDIIFGGYHLSTLISTECCSLLRFSCISIPIKIPADRYRFSIGMSYNSLNMFVTVSGVSPGDLSTHTDIVFRRRLNALHVTKNVRWHVRDPHRHQTKVNM